MPYSGLDVVGESHHLAELHQIIRLNCGGQLPERGEIVVRAELVREPNNAADARAVSVLISGLQVGHVPRGKAQLIHDAFAEEAADWLAVEATIGWARPEVIGVRLTGIDEDLGLMQWEETGLFESQDGSRFATGNRRPWVVAGLVVVAIAAFTLAPRYIDDFGTTVAAFVIMAVMIGGYLLPMIIAGRRKHHNLGAIMAVNLLLGWTFLGWIIAFIWSLTAVRNPYQHLQRVAYQPVPAGVGGPVQYQVGDVVNGYRWNGESWLPTL
jgi:Superinfection immunity protein